MNLGEKLGVDLKMLAAIMSKSTGGSFASSTYTPVDGVSPTLPASNDFNHGFANELMIKDIKLALKEASERNLDLQFAKKSTEYYQTLIDNGNSPSFCKFNPT